MLSMLSIVWAIFSLINFGYVLTITKPRMPLLKNYLVIMLGPIGLGMIIEDAVTRQRRLADELTAIIRETKTR